MRGGLDLFVTGMFRSGTTLLEKLLCNHPALSVASQPAPYLWIELKRAFLATLGAADLLPLGSLFPEPRYTPEDFEEFLRHRRLDADELEDWLRAMRGYSGQHTPVEPSPGLLDKLDGLSLSDVLRTLNRAVAHRPGARGFGSKEVICEEYLPYLLTCGFHVVLILRDPRDVLASMRGGRGEEFVGPARPLLHDLRCWRRSAAYALALGDQPRCHVIRYEDLVRRPEGVLGELVEALELEPYPENAFRDGIRDQAGRPWGANSSHGGGLTISTASVGAHRRVFDDSEIAYVETLCWPEMRALGFRPSLDAPDPKILESFVDRRVRRKGDVPPDLDQQPAQRELERRRLAILAGAKASSEETASLFRFESVARRLVDALRSTRSAQNGSPAST